MVLFAFIFIGCDTKSEPELEYYCVRNKSSYCITVRYGPEDYNKKDADNGFDYYFEINDNFEILGSESLVLIDVLGVSAKTINLVYIDSVTKDFCTPGYCKIYTVKDNPRYKNKKYKYSIENKYNSEISMFYTVYDTEGSYTVPASSEQTKALEFTFFYEEPEFIFKIGDRIIDYKRDVKETEYENNIYITLAE